MRNIKRKISLFFFTVFMFLSMSTMAFASTTSFPPYGGYTPLNFDSSSFIYSGSWNPANGSNTVSSSNGSSVSFDFKGTNFIVIGGGLGVGSTATSDNVEVNVDGSVVTYINEQLFKVGYNDVFNSASSISLSDSYHHVILTNKTDLLFHFEGIEVMGTMGTAPPVIVTPPVVVTPRNTDSGNADFNTIIQAILAFLSSIKSGGITIVLGAIALGTIFIGALWLWKKAKLWLAKV